MKTQKLTRLMKLIAPSLIAGVLLAGAPTTNALADDRCGEKCQKAKYDKCLKVDGAPCRTALTPEDHKKCWKTVVDKCKQ